MNQSKLMDGWMCLDICTLSTSIVRKKKNLFLSMQCCRTILGSKTTSQQVVSGFYFDVWQESLIVEFACSHHFLPQSKLSIADMKLVAGVSMHGRLSACFSFERISDPSNITRVWQNASWDMLKLWTWHAKV